MKDIRMKEGIKGQEAQPLGETGDIIKILITGQVDHGKSTLIGRLLYECGQMAPEVRTRLDGITKQYGQDAIEWAFALDSLELEREQGITLDASRIWLKRADKELVLIDVPGHHELLANMLTGASDADAALVLVDASEGVTRQTRLHAKLLGLLGIEQIVIAITKMDTIGYDEQRFKLLAADTASLFEQVQTHAVPISAKAGDNLTDLSPQMPWYKGKPLLTYMDALTVGGDEGLKDGPCRMLVQDVMKQGDQRIITGRVISGALKQNQPILACPSGSRAEVKAFICWPEGKQKMSAAAGESVGITLTQPIFSQRGEVFADPEALPYFVYQSAANAIWLGETSMQSGANYQLRLGVQTYAVSLETATPLARHELGEVLIKSRGLMVVDDVHQCAPLARFVLEDESRNVVAAGVMQPNAADDQKQLRLASKSKNLSPYGQPVTPERFEQRVGHKGAVFWMSGLSGAGKSTLAVQMQQLLFDKGRHVVVLDGDNIRGGLARDLGFSEADRSENIRRAAEVARLFAQHGSIVITAFITPTEADRRMAADICGRYLYQVHVAADVALCEQRDAKGLYKKARDGEIKNFTGISAPFDVPETADITIDTSKPVALCVAELAEFIEAKVKL